MLKRLDKETILKEIKKRNKQIFDILHDVGCVADVLQYQCYVVGGYVRDLILERDNDDIDVVVVGKGSVMANAYTQYLKDVLHKQHVKLSIFENFGTAQVRFGDFEVEFVGARKESYERGSRKPIVEEGTLQDDQLRRDFTINAMAIQLNADHFGELVDPFGGIVHLKSGTIKTPTNPDVTFSDDPLRMLRAVRFACKLGFGIEETTYKAIIKNLDRLDIISTERIMTEFLKIMGSDYAADGIEILKNTGLLKKFLPEVDALDTTGKCGPRYTDKHKNIYWHTLDVLRNVCVQTDNVYLRIAALLHDIGKIPTRHYDAHNGYSFDNHEYVGAKMVESIFKRLKLPQDENMKFTALMVQLHMRPQAICGDEVTDAGVRRLVHDANGYINELLILANSDITTKNESKKQNFQLRYNELMERIDDIARKDYVRMFQPCVTGDDLMEKYHLEPGKKIGEIKQFMKDALLDNIIENTPEALYEYIEQHFNLK